MCFYKIYCILFIRVHYVSYIIILRLYYVYILVSHIFVYVRMLTLFSSLAQCFVISLCMFVYTLDNSALCFV